MAEKVRSYKADQLPSGKLWCPSEWCSRVSPPNDSPTNHYPYCVGDDAFRLRFTETNLTRTTIDTWRGAHALQGSSEAAVRI